MAKTGKEQSFLTKKRVGVVLFAGSCGRRRFPNGNLCRVREGSAEQIVVPYNGEADTECPAGQQMRQSTQAAHTGVGR